MVVEPAVDVVAPAEVEALGCTAVGAMDAGCTLALVLVDAAGVEVDVDVAGLELAEGVVEAEEAAGFEGSAALVAAGVVADFPWLDLCFPWALINLALAGRSCFSRMSLNF